MASAPAVVSLDNLDALQQQWVDGRQSAPEPVLNSPRSLEACKRAGVKHETDLAKPVISNILKDLAQGSLENSSMEPLTPQRAAILQYFPFSVQHIGSFEDKRAAVEKFQHLEARRTTTIRMLQEIRQQLAAAEEFTRRKANPNLKKLPATLPPTANAKKAVPQLPLPRRLPSPKNQNMDDDSTESLVSISTATASEQPRFSSAHGTSTTPFVPRKRNASPSSSDDDDGDSGVEIVHITSTGKDLSGDYEAPQSKAPVLLSPAAIPDSFAQRPPLELFDRVSALKDRGLHRVIKTPAARASANKSVSPPRRNLLSSPQLLDNIKQDVAELQRVPIFQHSSTADYAAAPAEVPSLYTTDRTPQRDLSPMPMRQRSGSDNSSSPSNFETNKVHRRQLINAAVTYRAQHTAARGERITSPKRKDVLPGGRLSPYDPRGDYNYRSTEARYNSLHGGAPSMYA